MSDSSAPVVHVPLPTVATYNVEATKMLPDGGTQECELRLTVDSAQQIRLVQEIQTAYEEGGSDENQG